MDEYDSLRDCEGRRERHDEEIMCGKKANRGKRRPNQECQEHGHGPRQWVPPKVRGGLEETDRGQDDAEMVMLQNAIDRPHKVRWRSLSPDQPVREQDQPKGGLKLGAHAYFVEEARERDASSQEHTPYESRNHRPIRKSWKPVLPPNRSEERRVGKECRSRW